MQKVSLEKAIQVLKNGGIVFYPTETVYGIGGNALDPQVIDQIYELKGRPQHLPISVLIDSIETLRKYAVSISPSAEDLMRRYWPGPLTLIFEVGDDFPQKLHAGSRKVGFRISSHPQAQALVQALGLPMTTTSANPSGKKPAESVEELQNYFKDSPLIGPILDGGRLEPCEVSTVLDVSADPPRIIREGVIRINLF
ncbi:MAG: threonylcarbamoyl-AMP synthase [Deltaproteobacteria bacterium]|nr:threonylcarbamoyl-AMP synthase [Deltaproteobacteria bacterium]